MSTRQDRNPEGFEGAKRKAYEFARDKEKTGYLLDEAVAKAKRYKTVLDSVWEDLQTLLRLVGAWKNQQYQTPWRSIIIAISGIIYFVNPFDIVPDFIPGAGFLDDATVIGFVLKSIKEDIEQYIIWEKQKQNSDA
jgi:uncharacterized membrane protein YkvA (DUF1232 family)